MTRENIRINAAFRKELRDEIQRVSIEDAIHQLHALESELREVHSREAHHITEREAVALKIALAEIHRLHHAVSEQRRLLEKRGPTHPHVRGRRHKTEATRKEGV